MRKLGVRTTFNNVASLKRKTDCKLLSTGTIFKALYILDTNLASTPRNASLVANLKLVTSVLRSRISQWNQIHVISRGG